VKVTLSFDASRPAGAEKTVVKVSTIDGQNMQERQVPEILLALVETCMANVRKTAQKDSPVGRAAARALDKFGYSLEDDTQDSADEDGMSGVGADEEDEGAPAAGPGKDAGKGTGTSGTSGTRSRAGAKQTA